MSPISRGFTGRRRPVADRSRVPPGQCVTGDFPVLSAGPTPHTTLARWSFGVDGAVDEPASWTWQELTALPAQTITVDIHCVTKWSKLGTTWKGVSVDTLLESVETEGEYVTAWSDGGYTTNLRLQEPRWTNVTVVTGDVVSEVSELKRQIQGEIVVYASRRLVHTLMEHDLVDEVRLMVFPVVLGAGERLFGEASDKKPMRLIDARAVGDGLAYLTYEAVRAA
jgi:hypothetical protein